MNRARMFFLLLLAPVVFAALPSGPNMPCPFDAFSTNYQDCAASCTGYYQACDISACERECRNLFCRADQGDAQVCRMNLCLGVDDACYSICQGTYDSCVAQATSGTKKTADQCKAEKDACDARCPGEVDECVDSCLENSGKWDCSGSTGSEWEEVEPAILVEEEPQAREEGTCGGAVAFLLLPFILFLKKNPDLF